MIISSLASLETAIISFERCLAYTEVDAEHGYKELVNGKINGPPFDEAAKYV